MHNAPGACFECTVPQVLHSAQGSWSSVHSEHVPGASWTWNTPPNYACSWSIT